MDSTLATGLAVLDWLVRQPGECRLVDVAQAHGLARSNAHRTLQTLVQCGWAVQNRDNSNYRPSLRLFELGTLVDAAADTRALLHPHLAALARASGETIHLTVIEGAQVVYLDKFDSPLPVAAYSRIGGRAPAQCVASGKALLAALAHAPDELQHLLGGLQAHTPHSITDHTLLQADLQRARRRGWAENREEWRVGVCGVGAPVFDARGLPVAAVGMSVPAIRFSRAQAGVLGQQVLACAGAASQTLGFQPSVVFADRQSRPRSPPAQTPRTPSSIPPRRTPA
jgi:DNA-binding IclR family transcriptional regulator